MPVAFMRTQRSMAADRDRGILLGAVMAVLLLLAWGAWAIGVQVPVYVLSTEARLEVDAAAYPVDALLSGQVVLTRLELGAEVKQGDVLLELDVQPQRLELDEEKARTTAAEAEIAALEDVLEAERQVLAATDSASGLAIAEAHARRREAEARAQVAREKARQWDSLRVAGLVSGVEERDVRAAAEQTSESATAQGLGAHRVASERRKDQAVQKATIERLRHNISTLRGTLATRKATIARLEYEINRRMVRAPTDGRLGQIFPLRVGSVVESGQRLATVIPYGTMKAVAYYAPSDAAGRIRSGQPARLRLDGFPWAQYGHVGATVSSVATEPANGQLRVELAVHPSSNERVPLEHGLPGTVEIAVERLRPATMLLRAAGELVDPPRTALPGAAR
jgi:membrane fusion protein (multidrug efflux system)